MKIGVSFPTTEVGNDPIVMRDFAQAAEDMGYEYLTVIDHVLQARDPAGDDFRAYHTIDNAFHEPLILFSYLAGVTSKIGFVTAILILPQRPTVLVAKQAAQLDVMSADVCGSAAGSAGTTSSSMRWIRTSRTGRGVSPNTRLNETAWTEETVTFEGESIKLTTPVLILGQFSNRIPLWIGASFVDPAIRRAGQIRWLARQSAGSSRCGSRAPFRAVP